MLWPKHATPDLSAPHLYKRLSHRVLTGPTANAYTILTCSLGQVFEKSHVSRVAEVWAFFVARRPGTGAMSLARHPATGEVAERRSSAPIERVGRDGKASGTSGLQAHSVPVGTSRGRPATRAVRPHSRPSGNSGEYSTPHFIAPFGPE